MWFDDLFRRLGGSSPGEVAWNQSVGRVPIIGEILGAYMVARENPIDLDNPYGFLDLTGGDGFGGWDKNDSSGTAYARNDYGDLMPVDAGGSGGSNGGSGSPYLQADNSTPPAGGRAPDPVRPEQSAGSRPENAADFGPTSPYQGSSLGPDVRVQGPPRQNSPTSFRYMWSNVPHGRFERLPPSDYFKVEIPLDFDSLRSSKHRPTGSTEPEPPPPPRPELDPQDPQEEYPGVPAGEWTRNIAIKATPSFDRDVSDPDALAAAEGRGHIEWGDLVQLGRGLFNGLVSAWQEVSRAAIRSGIGTVPAELAKPYTESLLGEADAFRLTIDPRYGGAGIMGEQLGFNLAFEALPYAPQAVSAARRALSSERMLDVLLAPAFSFTTAGPGGGGTGVGRALSRARSAVPTYKFIGYTPVLSTADWALYQTKVGSEYEAVFEVTQNGRKTYIFVDHIEGKSLIEAKWGDMGQLWDPEREAHFHEQVQNYLALREARGFENVIYRVSTEKGAERLRMIFDRDYGTAYRSKLLQVEFVPFGKRGTR